ncbi:phage tail tape measure protein [Burkholderia gladioli]|uniref:phage tail tape measure protein n=1 Tax=Burkholderia gladioli TaxID=28095 RepID=UPI001640248D|nr:hypothetical protein [Burkholderia gladioli]
MSQDLKLRVVFDMVDRLTRPLKQALAGSKGLSKEVGALQKRLSELQKQQKSVAAIKALRAEMGATATKLKTAAAEVDKWRTKIQATSEPSKQMQNQLRRASAAVGRLSSQYASQRERLGQLSTRMQDAGRGTRNLVQYERDLKTQVTQTSTALAQQNTRLQGYRARQAALGASRANVQQAQALAANMTIGGYAARGTGMRMLGALRGPIEEAQHAQTEEARIRALGYGDGVSNRAIRFARNQNTYGTSTNDNLMLMRDSLSIFGDEHHAQMATPVLAKMKFANEAVYGAEHGGQNEQQFMNMLKAIELRGGTKDEATFHDEANRVQRVISATGGRVGGDQWMEFIKRGGVAAKSLSKDAFYYQMEPLIQEMGGDTAGNALMSGYQNLIEGRTTVRATRKLMKFGLLDPKKVEYDKNGHVKAFGDGALLNAEQFKNSPFEWMQKTLVPLLKKRGITSDKAILSTIGSMFTNRSASNLFSTMYLQRGVIEKNERNNRNAADIDQLNAQAKKTGAGKMLEAIAQWRKLKQEIGEQIAPAFSAGLERAAHWVAVLTQALKANPAAAKAVIGTFAALGAIIGVGGTLTIGLAALIGPFAMLRFGLKIMGEEGGLAARAMGWVASAFRFVGSAFAILGRLLFMNPIGLAITAIAVAAFLIYEYWGPIKTFFSGLWAEVRAAFDGGIAGIGALILNWSPIGLFYRAFATVMSWFGIELPKRFSEYGANMVAGLVSGISGAFSSVKGVITSLGDSVVAWFKEKLGIHSPSRVFDALGGFIGQGAAQGIDGERVRVAKSAASLAGAASIAFGAASGPALASGADYRPLVDARAPLAATRGRADAGGTTTNHFNITINAASGDPREIEAAVRRALDSAVREQRRRAGSSLSDRE